MRHAYDFAFACSAHMFLTMCSEMKPEDRLQPEDEVRSQTETQERVKGLIKGNHLTQRAVAEGIGMSEQSLSQKLKGVKHFTADNMKNMAKYFGVTTDYLYGLADLTLEVF